MKVFEGKLVSKEIKVGIVASRFNEFITSKLLSGAMDGLLRHDVRDQDVHVAWVPGAFEIPLIASKMAKSGNYDAVICLGAVIRGSTSTMTMCAMRCQRALRLSHWKAGYLSCLEYSPPRISSRPSREPGRRREIRDMTAQSARLRW